MHLLLALLLQTSVPVASTRAEALAYLDALDRDVQKLERFIKTRFDADVNQPQTGMVVESADAPGADGLHALTVTRVVIDGPADTAGVRPGDRITHIDDIRVTHETAAAFGLRVNGKSGIVRLTLARGGTVRTATVDRAPLACVRQSSERIDLPRWLSKVGGLRRLADVARVELDDESIVPAAKRYEMATRRVAALYGVLGDLGQKYLQTMIDIANETCAVRMP